MAQPKHDNRITEPGSIGGYLLAKLGRRGFGALLDGMYRRCK